VVPAALAPLAGIGSPTTGYVDDTHERTAHRSGGFWSTAWPYILGTVALAAGGAAVWWFGIRPNSDVTVGAPRVTLVP